MTPDPDRLRRDAKRLRRDVLSGNPEALARVRAVLGPGPGDAPGTLKHAEALHVIAREAGFDSWPKLKLAAEAAAMDRAARAERLKLVLFFGQHWVAEALLSADPGLSRANLGLAAALYDAEHVREVLARDPGAATRSAGGPREPLCHLAFSRHLHAPGADTGAMLEVAEALLEAGADVNRGFPHAPGSPHRLSPLYGALCHARNLPLARWLLARGADPNDDESLYHATELDGTEGLRLLLAHGAETRGTNALLRALDFDDAEKVALLLQAGADPDEAVAPHPSGEAPATIPALHQAARRMCGAEVVGLLLAHGAKIEARHDGLTAHALARVHGNRAAAEALAAAGADTALSETVAQLARAADDAVGPRDWIDMARLGAGELSRLMCRLSGRPDALGHIERLLRMGFDANVADEMGLTPLHLAGWEGLPETVALLLRQSPDLGHVNGYGGSFLTTIIHGSENCPARAGRDHIGCARMALEHGVALPRRAIALAGEPEMAAFLEDWGARHPGQVVDGGIG